MIKDKKEEFIIRTVFSVVVDGKYANSELLSDNSMETSSLDMALKLFDFFLKKYSKNTINLIVRCFAEINTNPKESSPILKNIGIETLLSHNGD